jgi:hypothetical protein
MDKIQTIKVPGIDGIEKDFVIINRGNDEYTSMLKSEYDEQQAALSTPRVTDAD